MVNYTGKHGYILIGKETTWGTAVNCTKDIGLVQSCTVTDDNSLRRIYTLSQRNTNEIVAGRFSNKISLEVLFQHGRMLEYALGSVSHTDYTNDAKHTFTEADTLPSLTLEDGFNSTSDVTLTYAGCKVDTLTLALSLDGQLTMRAELIGKTVATGTSGQAAVISSLTTFPDYMATLKTGTDNSEATLGNVQSIEWTIRNNLEPLGSLTHRLIQDLQANEREYEFTFTMAFQSKTEYELFLGGSAPTDTSTPTIPSVIITLDNGVAQDSGQRKITIDMANCFYSTVGTPTKIKGYIFQDFSGWAKALTSLETVDNIKEASW